MLFPSEDAAEQRLIYKCRRCEYSEPAGAGQSDNEVYSNSINAPAEEKEFVLNPEIVLDPALPRTKNTCPKCANEEAVFFLLLPRVNKQCDSFLSVSTSNAAIGGPVRQAVLHEVSI
eukprot:GABV01004641.1.p1 GENE.GABV01004641.1~~GABV01004641.1.p1  ORF type:complete len:133 (+),score=27.02 GABV01004641.1:49-399(+)